MRHWNLLQDLLESLLGESVGASLWGTVAEGSAFYQREIRGQGEEVESIGERVIEVA